MDFLAELSNDIQVILLIVGIALLFGIVLWNNKRNQHKRYNRDKRNFRKNYHEKKSKE